MLENPEPIKDIIKKIGPGAGNDRKKTEEKIFKVWKKAAGAKLAGHSSPASLRKKRLVINFKNSAWLFEFSLKKQKILERLKKDLGEDNIKELYGRIR